ncbi:HK97 gp10 family phage protein [Streptomyces sp. M2CJ-2]|uniref:HK97 gp10 family phage protein n=1 Tax=Streptomyces sp. M2CJ-2 TaxID=2803948 RepID=UPI001925444C|nr:HK97 gp10 family phage protein [Streptomyces sp. M2CJ-2]MBL3670808.1 HK97 gp10 family phage protein [Streptomyces sp. M2CJ-2]
MSGIRFEFDPTCLPEVMRSQQVRGALRKTAEEIVPRAKALARSEIGAEFADSITVSEEIRPRGRPTAKVIADREDASDHEYGSSSTERRRVLGRAARTGEG